jgi:hypothetical protein
VAAASSEENGVRDLGTAEISRRDSALTTGKGFLPFSSFIRPALFANGEKVIAPAPLSRAARTQSKHRPAP